MDSMMVFNHPLIQHKTPILRSRATGTNEFRALIEEIAVLMGYEALRGLPLEDVETGAPIEICMAPMIARHRLTMALILRAGLGIANGIPALVPNVRVGHVGLYGGGVIHKPRGYYCGLPSPVGERTIIITDPMLTVNGSGVSAVDFVKEHGGKKIKFMTIVIAPEGLKHLHDAYPNIQTYVEHLDHYLNEDAYTCSGLGDAEGCTFRAK